MRRTDHRTRDRAKLAGCHLAAACVLTFFTRDVGVAAADLANIDVEHLSLLGADRLLLEHSREVRAARRSIDTAQAGALTAAARQNPNLTLQTTNINPQVGIGPGGPRDKAFDTEVRLDYLVERGNKRELRIASASELERASVEDLSDTLRVQRAAVASAYYELMLAQERARIAHENAELYTSTFKASERRFAAGDLSATDVNRIRVDALRAIGDEPAAVVDRVRAQFALAMLGLLPMALSTDIGSETQRPLAIVVIGGLISATVLVLILLPVLYVVFAEGVHGWRLRNAALARQTAP